MPKIKCGAHIINLDLFKSIETNWMSLYVYNNVIYFKSFGVEHIPKEVKKNKNIITNIYRIQPYSPIMYGFFCIGFIDFMLKSKSLLEHTNLFFHNDYKKNDKIILKYFH